MGINILLKNTLNTFKKKKFQLIAIGMIICLSSFLYTAMFYAIDSLKTPLEDFVKVSNQEDFSIDMINGITKYDIDNMDEKYKMDIPKITNYTLSDIKNYNKDLYNNIMENRLEGFKSEYKEFNLELREFKEINFKNEGKSHKVTLYKDSDNINKSFLEEGKKPTKDNEIALSTVYANNNNLEINDTININNKKYTITGYVLFADNTMPMDLDSFIIDNSKMTLGLVNDNEYKRLKGSEGFYISAKFKSNISEEKKETLIKEFDKNVIELSKDEFDFITNITLTKNQMRSGGIYEELRGGEAMTIGISIFISSIAVLIILLITYKIIQSQKNQIGVLKSLGYSNKEILKPYIILLTIISLPMLLIGYFGGAYASQYMKDMYLMFYLIPNGEVKTNMQVLLIAIVVPLVVILGLSTILINKMLSKKSIELMKVSGDNKVGKLSKIASRILKNAKPQTKFKYSFILSNTSKFIVFFMGILFSSMLIIMSLMMSNFFDKMSLDYYNSVDYVYEGHVDLSKGYEKLDSDEEKFITLPNAIYNDENINLVGIDYENKLHNLFDKKDKNITYKLQYKVIVNSSFATTYDVERGDQIDISINEKEYTFDVAEVSKDYNGNKVYINRTTLSEILMDDSELLDILDINEDEFYNGVYSISKLDSKNYITVLNKEDILEQSEMLQLFIKVAVYYMMFAAIAIAVIILYVLSTMTIEDNYYSISLLKVMGYTKPEINTMILKSYSVYALISYLISVPITVIGFGYGMKYLASEFNMVIPFEFEIWHMFVGLIIIQVIFIIGSYAAKRRINKISLQEVLKEYRD